MPLHNAQQYFNRNRAKTTVLGVLTVILAVCGVRAFDSMQPQRASAMSPPRSAAAAETPHGASDTDMDKRARESLVLWSVLREKRGLEAAVAYHFDPTYYNLDPAKQREHDAAAADHIISTVPEKSGGNPTDQQSEKSHELHIQELARALVLQTTVLGTDPKALISFSGNSQVVRVGETIGGFKITSIQGRVVEIQKEGVTLGLKMGPE